jgi:DNA end-binding protein Ku
MAARSTWKGHLKLSLVSVPVKAYTATVSGGGDIRLNQLHNECKSRIQYKKTCPIHGEVKNEDIVSGYEHAKDQYVVVDTEELDKLRTEDDKAIKIDAFVRPDTIDPMYFAGRSYYLLPDGPVGQRPYAVLQQAMANEKEYALAQVVFSGREQLVMLRPVGRLIVMSMLNLDNEMTKPAAFEDDVPKVDVTPDEMNLAKTLIKSITPSKLDFAKYKDIYTEKLAALIQAKVEGKEVVAAPATSEPHVISLMDALKQSVAKAQGAAGEAKPQVAAKPPRKMAASGKKEAAPKKKKQA